MNNDPKIIDHIPNERRPGNGIWWAAWAVLAAVWAGVLATQEMNWTHVMLGLGTGIMLFGWVADFAGLETPASWRRKSRPKH